jgi:hypothetical protein
MKVSVSCPNVQFVVGSPRAFPIATALKGLGFEFSVRKVGEGQLASAKGSVDVELNTVEELFELQRSIGLTMVVEDGCIRFES